MARKIEFNLSVKSIEKAIKDMESYKLSLRDKCDEFCIRMTALGATTAQAYIDQSAIGRKYVRILSDIIPETMGCSAVLFAVGDVIQSQWENQEGIQSADISTVLMVEFGSGVKNGYMNPNAGKMGYGAGTFPEQIHAMQSDGWWYKTLDGEWHHSYGVKPTLPMYNASTEMLINMRKIAQDVFKS